MIYGENLGIKAALQVLIDSGEEFDISSRVPPWIIQEALHLVGYLHDNLPDPIFDNGADEARFMAGAIKDRYDLMNDLDVQEATWREQSRAAKQDRFNVWIHENNK